MAFLAERYVESPPVLSDTVEEVPLPVEPLFNAQLSQLQNLIAQADKDGELHLRPDGTVTALGFLGRALHFQSAPEMEQERARLRKLIPEFVKRDCELVSPAGVSRAFRKAGLETAERFTLRQVRLTAKFVKQLQDRHVEIVQNQIQLHGVSAPQFVAPFQLSAAHRLVAALTAKGDLIDLLRRLGQTVSDFTCTLLAHVPDPEGGWPDMGLRMCTARVIAELDPTEAATIFDAALAEGGLGRPLLTTLAADHAGARSDVCSRVRLEAVRDLLLGLGARGGRKAAEIEAAVNPWIAKGEKWELEAHDLASLEQLGLAANFRRTRKEYEDKIATHARAVIVSRWDDIKRPYVSTAYQTQLEASLDEKWEKLKELADSSSAIAERLDLFEKLLDDISLQAERSEQLCELAVILSPLRDSIRRWPPSVVKAAATAEDTDVYAKLVSGTDKIIRASLSSPARRNYVCPTKEAYESFASTNYYLDNPIIFGGIAREAAWRVTGAGVRCYVDPTAFTVRHFKCYRNLLTDAVRPEKAIDHGFPPSRWATGAMMVVCFCSEVELQSLECKSRDGRFEELCRLLEVVVRKMGDAV